MQKKRVKRTGKIIVAYSFRLSVCDVEYTACVLEAKRSHCLLLCLVGAALKAMKAADRSRKAANAEKRSLDMLLQEGRPPLCLRVSYWGKR